MRLVACAAAAIVLTGCGEDTVSTEKVGQFRSAQIILEKGFSGPAFGGDAHFRLAYEVDGKRTVFFEGQDFVEFEADVTTDGISIRFCGGVIDWAAPLVFNGTELEYPTINWECSEGFEQ